MVEQKLADVINGMTTETQKFMFINTAVMDPLKVHMKNKWIKIVLGEGYQEKILLSSICSQISQNLKEFRGLIQWLPYNTSEYKNALYCPCDHLGQNTASIMLCFHI